MNQAKPASGLTKFFQANPELMNEIFERFCGLQFAMVGERRCSTPK